ncbi:YidC/Oxa1 family membrane protein insertase [Candidatus Saccharibacteria bacterium]|nr:YidC/Oxa1 family membrane protein insertase [Candidatus Saccharibacteria bacterium]
MNIFDVLIVQPILNVLLAIYALLPGNDFGISLIIFTILIRLLMWPLVKKQLHQTKLMRKVQPELKKVKAKAKGNKALEAQLMMELYKERGIKPFSSIGVLIIQLPIFLALFRVIQIITNERDKLDTFIYSFMSQFEPIKELLANPKNFNESFFGIDLTRHAVGNEGIYIPLIILALIAAVFQYIQAKQTLPNQASKKKLRDILKESAAGKQADQSEISAIMSSRMVMIMPVILFFVVLYFPGALVLYYATFSIVAVIQQHIVLNRDEEELKEVAGAPAKKDKTQKRVKKAKEAKVVTSNKTKQKKRKRR